MGKISKILLNSLFISFTTAERFEITSCNDETSFPAMSVKICRQYFENYLSEETDFELSSDGAFYERTVPENELALSFDDYMDGKSFHSVISKVNGNG